MGADLRDPAGSPRQAALRVSLLNLLFAALWLLVADSLLGRWAGSVDLLTQYEEIKGLVFVAVTAPLLYLTLRRLLGARQIAERAAAEESEHFRLLVEGVRDHAIYFIEPDGRVASWNPGAERIKGYAAEEIVGQHFSCFYTPEDVARGLPELSLQTAARQGRYETEGWRVRKDGTRRWAGVEISALRDAEGRLRGFAKVTRDLTERRRAGEELRAAHERLQRQADDLERLVAERTAELQESNDDLQTFAHMTSHDLRAPLRAMQGFAQALLEDYSGSLDETGLDYARRIVAAAGRMDILIRDLLAYHRLTRSDLHSEDVPGDDVLDEAVAALGDSLRQRGAHLEAERPLPVPRGHRVTLAQILANLLDNATKYVSAGVTPLVKVRAESRPGRVRLWVEDNGIGLALVRKGAERMGGAAGAESEPGRGSRFWIEIPTPHPRALKEAV